MALFDRLRAGAARLRGSGRPGVAPGLRPASRDTAVFVAGDANIFFPALVALTSVARHNPRRFHFYMCFDGADLTADMARLLAAHDIGFIPATSLAPYETLVAMPRMADGDWPREIFFNWALPEHFWAAGYAYSIKVDYDLLCLAPYADLDRYRPARKILAAVAEAASKAKAVAAVSDLAKETIGVPTDAPGTFNAGFVYFNNRLAAETRFFERYHALYMFFATETPHIRTAEQCAAVVAAHNTPGGYRTMPRRYNWRVAHPARTAGLKLDELNLHFVHRPKPWQALTEADLARHDRSRPTLPFYRAVWIDYARTVEGFDRYCPDCAPPTPVEIAAMASRLVRTLKEQAAQAETAEPEGDESKTPAA